MSIRSPHLQLLMTTDAAGGVWDYSVELASGLRNLGVATVLAVMGDLPSEFQRSESAAVPDLCLEEGNFKLEWMQDPEQDLVLAGDWLINLNNRYQPDLIHVNSYSYASLPWGRPCVLVAHSCILSWWWQVKGECPPESLSNYVSRVTAGLNDADEVVFLTHSSRQAMEKIYGRFPRSRVIRNGRNPLKYRSAEKEPFIFSAGRLWDEAKNIFALENIAEDLSWPVLTAGNCKGPDGCEKKPEKTKYLGTLASAEIADFFARASIFAHPACYEPFGLAVLEAALAGCALVLGDIPTLRELWTNAAVFVPCGDNEALQNTLNALIEHPDYISMLGQKAHSRALMYNSEIMCQNYSSLYCDLLDNYSP